MNRNNVITKTITNTSLFRTLLNFWRAGLLAGVAISFNSVFNMVFNRVFNRVLTGFFAGFQSGILGLGSF